MKSLFDLLYHSYCLKNQDGAEAFEGDIIDFGSRGFEDEYTVEKFSEDGERVTIKRHKTDTLTSFTTKSISLYWYKK
jgi:hypothetical protein